jgi:photosystem II stability/assembly factor-like uncharacterized protein
MKILYHPSGFLWAALGVACSGGCHGAASPAGTGGSGQGGGGGGTGGATPVSCTGSPAPTGATPTLTPGQWQNISPPGLYRPGASKPPYGCMDIQVLPCNPYVLYLTTDSEGMWRSTDAGATWNQIGNLPEPVSPGVLAIDPRDPTHLYYGGGVRGQSVGFWVSTDGGDTWTEPAGFAAKADNSDDGWVNDVYEVKADPSDFNHVLLSFHSPWAFKSDAGVLESKDGGNSWIRHLPLAGWGAGHTIWFLGDSNTWLLGTQGDGYWRTADAGTNWTQVTTQNMQHGGTSAFTAKTGVLYVGALSTILRSEDNGQTFTMVGPQTSDGYYAIIGDGSRLYTARGNTGDSTGAADTYYVSDESDGTSWVAMNGQTFGDGPYRMSYDRTNGIIYSANWNAGVWALKVDDL